MWDYLFAQITTIPLSNKESSCKLISHLEDHLHTRKTICSIEIFFTVLGNTPYVKQDCNLLLLFHRVGDQHVLREAGVMILSNSREPTNFTGAFYRAFRWRPRLCALGGSNTTHTQLSSGLDSDTICKHLGYHSKRLTY